MSWWESIDHVIRVIFEDMNEEHTYAKRGKKDADNPGSPWAGMNGG